MKDEKAPGAGIDKGTKEAPACDSKKPQACCGLVSGCSPAHFSCALIAPYCGFPPTCLSLSFPFFRKKLLLLFVARGRLI